MTGPGAASSRMLRWAVGSLLLMSLFAAMLFLGLNGGRAAVTTIPAGQVEELAGAAMAGAGAEITSALNAKGEAGLQLVITPAREDIRKKEADAFAYGDAAWRADMLAASMATDVPDLNGYRLRAPAGMDVAVPSPALGVLQGSLPPPEAVAKLSDLGSISEKQALAQMAASLEVLQSTLPPPAVTATSVSVVPIDRERGRFALSVEIETSDGATLLKHAGDVMDGLQTGLVGDPSADIEGLAIVVREEGRPVAASWIAARAMAGTTMVGPGFDLPSVQAADADFPNLTGGPRTTASASGDVVQLPSLPTSQRIRLTSDRGSVYSAKGVITTPESNNHLAPRYVPHLRPRLVAGAGSEIQIVFSAPAHSVKVAVQRPSREEDHSVAVAHPIARRSSDNGLRWTVRAPGWKRLRHATTLRITAAYPAGFGQYDAGLLPVCERH